ncbi:MAG: organic hydroperoxide resistance protein [Planctomycetia bacterium]|nr:organic hydroperoxide resistance protein [Planctomycetia bacterium]
MPVLASETASATAGREGKATSPDGKINLNLSPPGSNGPGTNPEQLFAAGYSACFGGAIGAASALAKISLRPSDIKVTATVNLNKDDSGYFLNVTLDAELNGVDQLQAEALVAKAHTICPYSKATRGNIEVALQANGKAVHAVA